MAEDPKEETATPKPDAAATSNETPVDGSKTSEQDKSASKRSKCSLLLEPTQEDLVQQNQVPQIANQNGGHDRSLPLVSLSAILAVIGCMTILGFMSALRPKKKIPDMPCVSVQCEEVAKLTESFMDHSVSPCQDFYKHVCGHWTRDTDNPSSFMIDAARNLTKVSHQALTRNHTKKDYYELRQGAAIVYRSCLTFLEKQTDIASSAQEIFQALNLSVSEWLAETSWEQFFHKVLHLSLVSRFHTLVSIEAILSETGKTLHIRRQPPFHDLVRPVYRAHLANYVRSAIKAIGKEKASDAVIDEVLNMDETRAKSAVQNNTPQKRLDDISCPIFPAQIWRKVLEKELSLQEQVIIMITQSEAICRDLKVVLIDTNSVARPIYILTLLVGNVLKYDYELSENRTAEAVQGVCYQATAEAYEDIWLPLMSSFLSINKETEVAFDNYMNFTATRAKILVRNRSWMSERDRSATLGKLNRIRMSRFYGTHIAKHSVQCHSGKHLKVDGFLSNMVALRARDIESCFFLPTINSSDYGQKKILMGSDVVADHEAMAVYIPAFFAIDPLYYPFANDDKFINIAVVITQVARKVLSLLDRKSFNPTMTATARIADVDNETTDSVSRWSLNTLGNYSSIQQCYGRYSTHFHAQLSDSQFDEVFSAVEAMRLAHDAKCESDRLIVLKNKIRVRSSNALFFKRACLSLCTSRNASRDGAGTLDFETAYASCLFGVASLPQFAEAFDCKPGDPMWTINRCCVD